MAAKKGTWIGGTAVASLAIVAGAWFLAVSPQMAQAADLREQTDSVNSQNAALEDQIDQLKADYAHLDEYKQQLADLRTQIPTTDGLSDYLRELDAIATAHQVVITTVAPSPAQAFVPAATAATAAPTEEPTTDDGTATDTATDAATAEPGDATATPAPAPSVSVPAGFTAIPVSITVVGTYDNSVAFIDALQTGTKRLFLVSGVTGTAQQEQEASGGRPATAAGDQEVTVNGFLYVLPDTSAAAAAPDASAEPTPAPELPAAPPGRNPLVPIAGQ